MAPPPPPPPPPPSCFPFGSKKKRDLKDNSTVFTEKTRSESSGTHTPYSYDSHSIASGHSRSRSMRRSPNSADSEYSSIDNGRNRRTRHTRSNSFSPTATITSRTERFSLENASDSETNRPSPRKASVPVTPVTPASQKKRTGKGFGWFLWKSRQKEKQKETESEKQTRSRALPMPPPEHISPFRSNSNDSLEKQPIAPPLISTNPDATPRSSTAGALSPRPSISRSSRSNRSHGFSNGRGSPASTTPSPETPMTTPITPQRPQAYPNDSASTLVGSALERKMNDNDLPSERVDTYPRLAELRALMEKENLNIYIIPTEDSHGSEYVAPCDKRREYISGFTGSAGQAIITRSHAFLVADSRYWLQAEEELDDNWTLIQVSAVNDYPDWQSFLLSLVKEDMRIGIDARLISWVKASALNTEIQRKQARLAFPTQNLVDLVWKTKPTRSKAAVFIHRRQFSGRDADQKLASIRKWIEEQPPARPSYTKGPVTEKQVHVATLITNLSCIAWTLNLRGHDIPYNPVFQSYLFISLQGATLFVELAKIRPDVQEYLHSLGVEVKEYNDIWSFLRRAPWGPGKVVITEDTSYAISLLLTHMRYTVAPKSFVEYQKAIKNTTEIAGLRKAYLRDGASYVRWLAWMEDKFSKGYVITEYEAAQRLTEYRRKNEYYEGLAYENISASGRHAALPHYSPRKSTARDIDHNTPYLNDSGAQYLDGTTDTTRTVYFGTRPSNEQCEAYTRVLQGHIAIDTAIFPQGTSGLQLDVLARRALWKDGLNYLHGSGHGFGSYLNVHEGPHGFSSPVPLIQGHVITNEPGFYKDGEWGIRIESALLVRKIQTKHEYGGDVWLGFERLTCVPIQTKMIRDNMLTKEEMAWIKEHNKRCLEKLEPLIKDDKRALKWLRREADRGVGLAPSLDLGSGIVSVDWS